MFGFSKPRKKVSAAAIGLLAVMPLALSACGSDEEASGSSDTVKLRFASFIGKDDANMRAAQWWMDEIEKNSDGRITFDTFYEGSLVQAPDMLKAVADDRVDVGFAGAAYHEDQWPLSTVGTLPLKSFNAPAVATAMVNLYNTNEAAQAEMEKSGVRLVWAGVLNEAIIGTSKPISTPADLSGESVRGIGYSANVLADLGANMVTMPSPDIYEAIDRGVIAGYSAIQLNQVPLFGLTEVTSNVYGGWYGVYAQGFTIMNADVYADLDDDLKKVVDDASVAAIGKAAELTAETDVEACQALKDAGVEVETVPADVVEEQIKPLEEKYTQEWIDKNASGQEVYDDFETELAAAESEFSDQASSTETCANG